MFKTEISAALMALIPWAQAASVIYDLTDAHATVYYDLTNSLCGDAAEGDPFVTNWAELSGINGGIPYCQGSTAKSLSDLGTNRIVAMDMNLVRGDPSEWCGKEVQIIQSDGSIFEFEEGPLFIWDACEACASQHIVDLSAKAFVQLKGNTCAGNNPGGLTVQVLDNNIWDANSGGGSFGPSEQPSTTIQSTSASVFTSSVNTPSAKTTPSTSQEVASPSQGNANLIAFGSASAAPISTGPSRSSTISSFSVPSMASETGCEYGKWQCNGLTLQICNYVSIYKLDWETIAACPSTCDITISGSVDCQ